MFAQSISMSAGNYLSIKSEKEYFDTNKKDRAYGKKYAAQKNVASSTLVMGSSVFAGASIPSSYLLWPSSQELYRLSSSHYLHYSSWAYTKVILPNDHGTKAVERWLSWKHCCDCRVHYRRYLRRITKLKNTSHTNSCVGVPEWSNGLG